MVSGLEIKICVLCEDGYGEIAAIQVWHVLEAEYIVLLCGVADIMSAGIPYPMVN